MKNRLAFHFFFRMADETISIGCTGRRRRVVVCGGHFGKLHVHSTLRCRRAIKWTTGAHNKHDTCVCSWSRRDGGMSPPSHPHPPILRIVQRALLDVSISTACRAYERGCRRRRRRREWSGLHFAHALLLLPLFGVRAMHLDDDDDDSAPKAGCEMIKILCCT